MNIPAILLILILFAILMGFFSQDKIDYFPISLIIGCIAIVSMILFFNVLEEQILGFINFNTLIFIFSMQIIIYFATKNNVLEYISIKLIHITKGNNRAFFYTICLFTSIMVAFIEDLTLSLIMIPLIYRACQILKIRAGTYMMGMTITINIGAILTPVSSLKNLIIGNEFGWSFVEYFANMGLLFIIVLLSTVYLIDRFILRKEEKPTEKDKKIFLSLINPRIVITNKKNFIITFLLLISTFFFMILGFEPAFIATIFAALLLILHYKKIRFSELKNEISWELIITFAVLFILSNSLSLFGFSELISSSLLSIINENIYIAVLITLGISSLLSAFLAGTPVTILLLPIVSVIAGVNTFPAPIIIAFITGVNLAGNFLPQGSACDLLTLSLAKKYRVPNLNYKRLLKNGALFATIHFIMILGYTVLYTLILSYYL
ncbi:MAG: anion permease [Candidatus Lokiarchaeota archaeon]|nr:anion permease [Candidatus Lokiarchaeota archaeon]